MHTLRRCGKCTKRHIEFKLLMTQSVTLRIHSLDALAELLSDLDNLIIQRKPPLIRQSTLSGKSGKSKSGKAAKDEKYLKHRLWGYAEKVDLAFMEFYNFLFKFVLRPYVHFPVNIVQAVTRVLGF